MKFKKLLFFSKVLLCEVSVGAKSSGQICACTHIFQRILSTKKPYEPLRGRVVQNYIN